MSDILGTIDNAFGFLVEHLASVLFFTIYGFPLIVIVLLFGAFVFTIYFKFINVRGFSHAIDIIKGKYDNPQDDPDMYPGGVDPVVGMRKREKELSHG